MKEFFTQLVNLGLGAATVTRDAAQKLVNELIEKGEMTRKEGDEFIDKLTKRGQEAKKEFEDKVEKIIKNILKKLNVPTREEIDEIKQKLDSLSK